MKIVQPTVTQSMSTPKVRSMTTNTPFTNRYGATFLRNLTTSGASHRRHSSGGGACCMYPGWGPPGCAGAEGTPGALAGGADVTASPLLVGNAGMRPVSSATTTDPADG